MTKNFIVDENFRFNVIFFFKPIDLNERYYLNTINVFPEPLILLFSVDGMWFQT